MLRDTACTTSTEEGILKYLSSSYKGIGKKWRKEPVILVPTLEIMKAIHRVMEVPGIGEKDERHY